MLAGFLDQSFEHSLFMQILAVINAFAFFYVLNWFAFKHVHSGIRYVVWPLVIFMDLLIASVGLGALVMWLVRTER